MACRIYDCLLKGADYLAQQGVDFIYVFDGVAEKLNANGPVILITGKDLHTIPSDPESVAMEIIVVSGVVHGDQSIQ